MDNEENPVRTGKYQKLTLGGSRGKYKIMKHGSEEILIPAYEVPETCKTGDTLDVFVFLDGKEGLKATTVKAKAEVGDFAALKVKSVTDFGLFLDWGIKKDLFVPKALLRKDLTVGETAIVCLIPDFDGLGIIGSCQIDEFLDDDTSDLKENRKADLLVYGLSGLGYRVIIDNRYRGLLYKNEVFEELQIGDRRQGYIKKLRPDGRVDVILQPPGFRQSSEKAEEIILKALAEAGGTLPLHDKSSPEEIRAQLHMSKKIFKKSIGVLYKEKKLKIEEKGISLI